MFFFLFVERRVMMNKLIKNVSCLVVCLFLGFVSIVIDVFSVVVYIINLFIKFIL